MNKKVLIGVIAVVVVIVIGIGAWYFMKGKNNAVVPNANETGTVIPNTEIPAGTPTFNEAYQNITQAQKDCLLNILGQEKLNGFLNNDEAVMQTITGDEYQQLLACPQ